MSAFSVSAAVDAAEELASVSAVAADVGCHPGTILRRIHRGEIPALKGSP